MPTLAPTFRFFLFCGDPEQMSRYWERGFHFGKASDKMKFSNVNT